MRGMGFRQIWSQGRITETIINFLSVLNVRIQVNS